MKIQVISDTHGYHSEVIIDESVDMLIHAGDESNRPGITANKYEYMNFLEWINTLPIKHKILVPGNHSTFIYRHTPLAREYASNVGLTLLVNEIIEVDGTYIYGFPYTPPFFNWSFMKEELQMNRLLNMVDETDIFISHGPPIGILDVNRELRNCGSTAILDFVKRVKPTHHIFGHIHNNDIVKNSKSVHNGDTLFTNASFVDDMYEQFNTEPKIIYI